MRLHLSYSIQLLNPYVLSDLVPVVLFLFFFGLPSIWLLLFFWMKNNQNRRNHPKIEMKIFMISTKISGFLKEYWTVERNIRCHSIILTIWCFFFFVSLELVPFVWLPVMLKDRIITYAGTSHGDDTKWVSLSYQDEF